MVLQSKSLRALVLRLMVGLALLGCASVGRAPGKWSPSQVVEHVGLVLEESANVVSGTPSKFPTLPAFVRPMVRRLLFNRVLKKRGIPPGIFGVPLFSASTSSLISLLPARVPSSATEIIGKVLV